MSYGNILGQILQQGLGGQTQTRGRLSQTAESLGAGGTADSIFSQIQGALAKAGVDTGGVGQAAGGFADRAKDFLQKDQVGGFSGAQIGGIGAVAGALLGGGLGGAARGGAMAVLGTLALSALRNAQARAQAGAAPAGDARAAAVPEAEVEELPGPDTERLLVKTMISAAKADGQVDQAEMQKIIGKVSAEGVTEDEKQFVLNELRAPLDVAGLAASARTPAQAAQVYGASLLAIDVDTEQERQYLRDLARALRLDAATVQQLHQLTGVPAAA